MSLQYEQLRQEFIDEFGLDVLAQPKQDEIIDHMIEAVMKRIFVDTLEKLGETGMEQYQAFLEQNPEQEAIAKFLEERIPGYEEMVQSIVIDFKAEMKENK